MQSAPPPPPEEEEEEEERAVKLFGLSKLLGFALFGGCGGEGDETREMGGRRRRRRLEREKSEIPKMG